MDWGQVGRALSGSAPYMSNAFSRFMTPEEMQKMEQEAAQAKLTAAQTEKMNQVIDLANTKESDAQAAEKAAMENLGKITLPITQAGEARDLMAGAKGGEMSISPELANFKGPQIPSQTETAGLFNDTGDVFRGIQQQAHAQAAPVLPDTAFANAGKSAMEIMQQNPDALINLASINAPTAKNFTANYQKEEQRNFTGDENALNRQLKEEQIRAIADARKNTKDQKDEDEQDKLASKYGAMMQHATIGRMGNLGVQQTKLDSAIHTKQLINQMTDEKGNINVNPAIYQEMVMSVANMISGSSTTALETINSLKSPTAEGKLNELLQYWTGKPQNATSQELIKQLADITDRQGLLAEKMRDKYVSDLRKIADASFPALKKEYRDSFWNINYGNSFKDVSGEIPAATGTAGSVSGYAAGMVKNGYRFKGGDPADKNNWEAVQ